MSNPSGGVRSKTPLLVAVALFALLIGAAGLFAWQRLRPMFDADEIRQARAVLEAERRDLVQLTCSRTAIGNANATDQDALDEFALGPRWEECRRRVGEETVFQPAQNQAGHRFDWTLDRGDEESIPPAIDHAIYSASYAPPARSPQIDAAEAACEGLDEELARLAASTNLCTPVRPDTPSWDPDAPLLPMILIAKAVGLRARRAAREDGVFSGLQMLLRGVAVVRDFRRGPANLITAMISVAAEGVLVAHAVTLLMADPAMTASEYESLDTTLSTLVANSIPPHAMWRAERLAVADVHAAGGADEANLLVLTASSLDISWCPEGASAETCFGGLQEHNLSADEQPSKLQMALLGRRLNREAIVRWAHGVTHQSAGRYLARIRSADTNLGLVRTALAWSEARARSPRCPPELPDARLHVPESDTLAEVVLYDGEVYELRAPPLRGQPGAERAVYYLSCPASGVAWFDADGVAVSEPEEVGIGAGLEAEDRAGDVAGSALDES